MKNNLKKNLVKGTSLALALAMAALLAGCKNTANTADVESSVEEELLADEEASSAIESIVEEILNDPLVIEKTEIGEGATSFVFEVVDADGNTTYFNVHTDKKTVGEALVDCALVEGEESTYGLYVKTVNGITADYDVDQTYWAFYINGEYASTGVDATDVVEGDTYSFKVEK